MSFGNAAQLDKRHKEILCGAMASTVLRQGIRHDVGQEVVVASLPVANSLCSKKLRIGWVQHSSLLIELQCTGKILVFNELRFCKLCKRCSRSWHLSSVHDSQCVWRLICHSMMESLWNVCNLARSLDTFPSRITRIVRELPSLEPLNQGLRAAVAELLPRPKDCPVFETMKECAV